MKQIIVFFFIMLVFGLGLIAIAGYGFDQPTCYAKTKDIGYDSRWSLFGSCQIEVEEGRWIPLANWGYYGR